MDDFDPIPIRPASRIHYEPSLGQRRQAPEYPSRRFARPLDSYKSSGSDSIFTDDGRLDTEA